MNYEYSKMDYSPKLRQAMAEIKGILNKHDIAALVVLHTPGHGEHLLKLDPGYSSIKPFQTISENGEIEQGVRLQVDSTTHKTPEAKTKAITDSVNMVEIICTLAGQRVSHLFDLSDSIHDEFKKKGIDIDNTPGKSTDSREIDN